MITAKTRRGIIGLLLLTAISYWASRKQDVTEILPVAGLDPSLNYVLRDFELQVYDGSGKATFNLRAPALWNNPELKLGTIEQPVIIMHDQGVVWELTAQTATMTADKEHIHLSGQVQVQWHDPLSGNQAELETAELKIEVTPQTATTNHEVSLFDGLNQINAIGMNLNMKNNSYTLKQKVRATYVVN